STAGERCAAVVVPATSAAAPVTSGGRLGGAGSLVGRVAATQRATEFARDRQGARVAHARGADERQLAVTGAAQERRGDASDGVVQQQFEIVAGHGLVAGGGRGMRATRGAMERLAL